MKDAEKNRLSNKLIDRMKDNEKIEVTDEILEKMQEEMLTSNEFVKILCSICNCETIDRYTETLNNLTYLSDTDKKNLKIFSKLRDKLHKVPTCKSLLHELGLKSWDIYTYDKDELYTEDELDELFVLLEKKNIECKISSLVSDFVKDIKNGIFNENIITEMCNYNILLHVNTQIEDCYDELESIYSNYVDRKPLLTGIKELDENSIDFAKGEVTSLMGATGGFKTTFMTNIAYNKIKEGKNVVYLSLEIPKANMYYNLLSLHSTDKMFPKPIPHSELKRSILSEEERNILFKEVYPDFRNYKQHLVILDEKDIGLNSFSNYTKLLSKVDKQFTKETGTGIDILIVDHIQMLKNNTDLIGNNSYELVSKWVDYFRSNTVNFLGTGRTIATFIVSQVNRKGQEESDKNYGKYSLSAFADSSELERQSANVFSIKTDISLWTNDITFMVHKYRNLQLNEKTIHLSITPKYYAFKKIQEPVVDDGFLEDDKNLLSLLRRKESLTDFEDNDYVMPELEF